MSCTGLVAKDSSEHAIGIRTIRNDYIPLVGAIEALACIQAVNMGAEIRLRDLTVKGNARKICKKLQANKPDRSLIMAYVVDLKEIRKSFQTCKFNYTPRSRNKVAHILARKTLKDERYTYLGTEILE
ncbi:hypothetical protein PVK06_026464 [Gossypium arboreum]|uniref:RNase H type-1 domain-containing protein n=1 Tax=Gossypium arboreum TaxID=29729 RepID=A0ABR0NXS0_GOSAR|nr:hypothetical protein PVK06_026464 [Gossypium arboreum]